MKKRIRELLLFGVIAALGVVFVKYTIHVANTYVYEQENGTSFTSLPNMEQELVRIGDAAVTADVVTSPEAIMRGLGGRDALQEDTGMLFVFSDTRMRSFWMKGMRFAIDIIWIREGRIVGVTKRVLSEPGVPDRYLRRYLSPNPVDMVLEIQEGWAEMHGISNGMAIKREPI
jgi:uncharacterized protein